MKKITIKYDGAYPNLCSGQLVVTVDKTKWVFPDHCLRSSGSVWFDKDWSENVESGEWRIEQWPENFPKKLERDVLKAVNSKIPHGCCGGCL